MHLVAMHIHMWLRPHETAASPGRRPPLRPLWVCGCPLLPVRLCRLWNLPSDYRVPGPRYGNFSNALPLMNSYQQNKNKKQTSRHEPLGTFICQNLLKKLHR